MILSIAAPLLVLGHTGGTAQAFTVLHDFTGSDGAHPRAELILVGSALYGTAPVSDGSNQGTVFKVNTDGTGFTVLKSFAGADDGASPMGSLVSWGTTLYGTTAVGGAGGSGTVFKVNTDGTGFSVIHAFSDSSEGVWPYGGLLLDGNTLYGTTTQGGAGAAGGLGTVFKLNTDGSGYTVLKVLDSSEGAYPHAALILSGATLYGSTEGNVVSGKGAIFKLNTDGTGFAVLKEVNVSAQNALLCPLALSGTTLYGAASDINFYSSLFKLNTDGSGFTVLHTFTTSGGDPAMPTVAGPLLSATTLYATYGGTDFHFSKADAGALFRINTDGSGFAVLKQFNGLGDGANPCAGLVSSGTALYGTAAYGGVYNNGVVFSMGFLAAPEIRTSPSNQVVVLGSPAQFDVDAVGSPLPAYQWFFNGTNALEGATSASLRLASVQLSDAGSYSVVVSNGYGSATSAAASLVVWGPPQIGTPPLTQSAEAGASVSLSVTVTNIPPWPGYQWHFNTRALAGATDPTLYLYGVQPAQAGPYSVVITNPYGVVTSDTAALSVIPPVPRRTVPAIHLSGDAGSLLHLICADTPGPGTAWQTLDTMTLTNPPQLYLDLSDPLRPSRFYRVWQTNVPSVRAVLDLGMATEIPLAGAIGSTWRVDCINQIGPTNAWVTLDTVTLTNTTQPYFDLTMWLQPPRLYRLVPVP